MNRTITTEEIKAEIMNREKCNINEIKCYYCAHWGYNKGDWLTNSRSKCTARKKKLMTDSFQFCRRFKIMN